ncbi:MAG: hypothetical protein Q7S52_01460 [bacterium]|nr:hypothetical protein [bacterium]
MLKLFLLQRKSEVIEYDSSIALVVAAEDEVSAREVASAYSRSENSDTHPVSDDPYLLYDNPEESPLLRTDKFGRREKPEEWKTAASCTSIGIADQSVRKGVVIESYHYA